jgi:magnesium transporter
LGVLLLSTELVTITWQELPVVDQVLQHLQKQTGDPRLRWLIAEIFQSLAQHFLRVLKQINRDIRAIEMELRESQSNEDFFRMLTLQKALTLFSSALRGNITTAQKVLQLPQMQIDEADAEEIADAIVDLQQAREMTDLYGSTITNLMDAYIGVLQNNISNTLKIVTGWTVIIAIPMTVATIYGMNVPLPMQTWHYATPVLLGSAFLLAGLAFAFFHRNDWI